MERSEYVVRRGAGVVEEVAAEVGIPEVDLRKVQKAAREALKEALRRAWDTDPNLKQVRRMLEEMGEKRVAPVIRRVVAETQYDKRLSEAFEQERIDQAYQAVWGTKKEK